MEILTRNANKHPGTCQGACAAGQAWHNQAPAVAGRRIKRFDSVEKLGKWPSGSLRRVCMARVNKGHWEREVDKSTLIIIILKHFDLIFKYTPQRKQ